ncbi:hypothetical protein GCM10020295_34750 [Streptomyces cinereospinus]
MAMAHHPRARATAPRFDRRGFPMGPKDRAARRARLRARAVTTTVVATVVAAPVLALWSAYRGGPGDEGGDGRGATAGRDDGPGVLDGERASGGYENAGNAGSGARFSMGNRPDVSVEVISVAGAGRTGPGRLRVAADNSGDTTLITLTASGSAPRPLVREHERLLALPEPVLGNPPPRPDVDDQGVRRPAARAVRVLERAGGGLTRRDRLHPGVRQRGRPVRPRPGSRPGPPAQHSGRPRSAALSRPRPVTHDARPARPHAERPGHTARPRTHPQRVQPVRPGKPGAPPPGDDGGAPNPGTP